MKKQKQGFHYELQDYQENCINSIINLFDSINQKENFKEIMSNHYDSNQYNFPIEESRNIDIMMETGTGKTFTFIKTIFELNKNFGYRKFIILIPTVPIREGTKSNFEDTKEYFKGYYANEVDKEIETFVYEGGNISSVNQFINATRLSVLILTSSSFNSRDNILNRPLEKDVHTPDLFTTYQDMPKSYLDCLKRLNPIIIMDEPHRFDGDAFKAYFEGFDNYYLRFGATFPKRKNSLPLSNVAYVLDSISSFQQSLVKKIVVYTQDIVENTDTLLSIENKKALVNTLSNGVLIKRTVGIGSIFNNKSIKKINKSAIVLSDDTIEKIDYSLSDDSIRTMIKDTIRIHFEKEEALFNKGIKALTLFFMESDISLFRGDKAKVRKIFEEEYIQQRSEILQELEKSSSYYQYLQNDFDDQDSLQVHKGYFSGDKEKTKDEKIKAGVNEILKDKKKLLSFGSSTRFIFSIWALQEGWDNPNVFTICKLSNQGSDTSKLQQIGRGLRICVNQNLERQTLSFLDNNQENFWQINNLDVVVSSKEQGFVKAIQDEVLKNSYLIAETFTAQELKILLKDKGLLDDLTVRKLYKILEDSEMIVFKTTVDGLDVFEKSLDFSKILKEQDIPNEQKQILHNLFVLDTKLYIQGSEDKQVKKKVIIKNSHLKDFKALWNTINKNAFYSIENLPVEQELQLINNIKNDIESLNINEVLLQTIKSELHIHRSNEQSIITKELFDSATYQSKVDYIELIHTISNNTKTPLYFNVKIFNALSNNFKRKILRSNPQQVQKEICNIIRNNLISTLKANITYDGVSGKALPNVFKTKDNKSYLETGSVGKFQKDITSDFSLKSKWVFEEVIEYDSAFELEIIEQDQDIDSIEFFGKLPRLKIKTPLGEYNPDFCYAVKGSNGNKVFLVVESKGYDTSTEIPTNEKSKIEFAKEYFKALNNYYLEKGIDNIKISFKERINCTQLSSLILK